MAPRGTRRPGDFIPRPRRKVIKVKAPARKGSCSMSVPAVACRTAVVLAQLAAVELHLRAGGVPR